MITETNTRIEKMTKRKKIEYTFANGDSVTGGRTTVDRKVENALQMPAYGGAMMRIGDHSVFLGYFDVAVSKDYYAGPEYAHIEPVWKCAEMRDTRIGQIAKCRTTMNRFRHHPHYHAVMNACYLELTMWEAHGETPKHYGG